VEVGGAVSRRRLVTRADIEVAICVAQVMATSSLHDLDLDHFRCASDAHCESCDCELYTCDHRSEWDCVCAAIGGTPQASSLYLAACTELDHWLNPSEHYDCADECGESLFFLVSGPVTNEQLKRLSWGNAPDGTDLEISALLADGWLPVGWGPSS
jgi:hypothetical protein